MGAACFGALWSVCRPFNKIRAAMFILLASVFCLVPIVSPSLRKLFYLTPLSVTEYIVLGVLIVIVWAVRFALSLFANRASFSGIGKEPK